MVLLLAENETMMKLLVFFLLCCSFQLLQATTVRHGNGGNCAGVKSCRPRCITFRIDRSQAGHQCQSSSGIFADHEASNPWHLHQMNISHCEACLGDPCRQNPWVNNLAIGIVEQGKEWSFATESLLKADEDRFTFCSVYHCPKHECALPEQIGSEIHFTIHRLGIKDESTNPQPLLKANFNLKKAFTGKVLMSDEENRFGPIYVDWMDDPTGCRLNEFSPYAPVAPMIVEARASSLTNPHVAAEELFCQGIEYEPHPLPQTAPKPTEVTIDLWFAHVARVMDADETETFEKLTREYMRENQILLEDLKVSDQSVRLSKNMPANVVVTPYQRRLRPSLSLNVEVKIKAWNAEDVRPVLEEDWGGYLSFLAIGLDFLQPKLFVTKKTQDWKLLGTALGLALAAVASVIVVRRTGRRRVEHHHHHVVAKKSKESTPSITPHDIVSLESDGGWNSADSPSDDFHDIPLDDGWRESKSKRKVVGTLIYV